MLLITRIRNSNGELIAMHVVMFFVLLQTELNKILNSLLRLKSTIMVNVFAK